MDGCKHDWYFDTNYDGYKICDRCGKRKGWGSYLLIPFEESEYAKCPGHEWQEGPRAYEKTCTKCGMHAKSDVTKRAQSTPEWIAERKKRK